MSQVMMESDNNHGYASEAALALDCPTALWQAWKQGCEKYLNTLHCLQCYLQNMY
jgi:hypothetical protein